ncbi:hypothetical protein CL684_03025 [Candidatus Campbellbacteria bacterium]|nr:hypothetical protein [Candidatus Campbellbacteria bacterium]|tara:strand:- start:1327 stop:1860 length:534 start_codon:yes stop_codon:yes gene_type:complete
MQSLFIRIFRKKDNLLIFVLATVLVFLLARIIPIWEILTNSFKIPDISLSRKFSIFSEYIFIYFIDIPIVEQATTIILSLALGINTVLFYQYIKKQQKIFAGKSFLGSSIGVMLGVFGVGCVSCGALVIAPILTGIGLGAQIGFISQYALLISWAGIAGICISSYYLLLQINKPLVC